MRTSNKELPTVPIKRTPDSLMREARLTKAPTLSPSVQRRRMLLPRGFGKGGIVIKSHFDVLRDMFDNIMRPAIVGGIERNSNIWASYRGVDDIDRYEMEHRIKLSDWIGDDLSNVVEFLEDGFTVTLK